MTLIFLMSCMIYLYLKGDKIDERSLMNIGYAMIGGILIDVAINLITLLITGIIAMCVFFKKCCSKKSKARYKVEPQTKDTELEFTETNKLDRSNSKVEVK